MLLQSLEHGSISIGLCGRRSRVGLWDCVFVGIASMNREIRARVNGNGFPFDDGSAARSTTEALRRETPG